MSNAKNQSGDSKPTAKPEAYETALNDLRVEMMILRDVNAPWAMSASAAKAKSESDWREQMKKEGIFENVLSKVNQFKALTDAKSRELFLQDIQARVNKGDRVAANFVMGVMWPQIHATKSTAFIRQMSLVYLVAQFENYLQKILSVSYVKYPAIVEKKTISFGELASIGSVGDAQQIIREKEASDRINEGIDKVAEYLLGLWNVQLKDYEKWSLFRERFYRRNVIIHDAGRPSHVYREKTGYTGTEATLGVDEQYLAASLQLFDEVATLLCERLKG